MTGMARGITMRANSTISCAPSMRPASRKSSGMSLMAWRRRNTPKAFSSPGMITAA